MDKKKILLVTSVENTERCVKTWTENVHHLKKYDDEFCTMFIHLDGENSLWKTKFENYDNYMVHLNGGSKVTNWRLLSCDLVKQYDFLWLVDSDISLKKWDWNLFKPYALTEIVLQSAVMPRAPGKRSSDHSQLRWKKGKTVTQYKRIETMAPFDSTFWPIVYEKLLLTDKRSAWETEFWYSAMAKKLMNKNYLCVVHVSPIIHLDWRSMKIQKIMSSKDSSKVLIQTRNASKN